MKNKKQNWKLLYTAKGKKVSQLVLNNQLCKCLDFNIHCTDECLDNITNINNLIGCNSCLKR
jgi:hypothetical protein